MGVVDDSNYDLAFVGTGYGGHAEGHAVYKVGSSCLLHCLFECLIILQNGEMMLSQTTIDFIS